MSNKYLGDFTSIGAVWSKYPEGGKPNDFLTVNGVRYNWSTQLNSWITPNQMQERGWGADNVNGDLYIENDLRVGGTVYANNIRHPYKGLFGSFEQLKRCYPNPKPGDFADVGYTSPSTRYACEVKHEWTDTGQEGVDPSVILPPELSDMELISRWGYVDDDARLTVNFSQRKVSWGESSVHFGKLKKVDIQQGEHLAQSSMSSSEKVGYLVFDKVERIFNYYTPSTVPPTTDDIVLIAVFIDKKVSFSTSLIFDADGNGISPLQIVNDTIGTPGDEANAAGTIFSRIAFLANEIGERNEAPDIVGKIFGRLNYLTPISRKTFNLTLIESLTESSSVEEVMTAFIPENFTTPLVPDTGDYLLGKVNSVSRITQKAVVQNVSYSSDLTRRIQIAYNVGYGVTVVTINSQWRFISKKRFGLPNFEAEGDVENAQLSDFEGTAVNPKSVAKNISTVDGGNVEAKLSDLDNRVLSQKADVDAAKDEALQEINNKVLSFNEGVTPEMLSQATMDLINASGGGTIINQADDEDLTKETTQGGTEVMKFADKAFAPAQFSGLARKYLRKNVSNDANVLTQDIVNEPNTIYHIQYDYDLQGATITIPENSILFFDGGSYSNGKIVGQGSNIKAERYQIFKSIELGGTFNCDFPVEWFGASYKKTNNEVYINELIKQLYNTENGGVVSLSNAYEISDSIYLYPKVSIIGEGRNSPYFTGKGTTNLKSAILANFSDKNKWIIDTILADGTKFSYDVLSPINNGPWKGNRRCGIELRDFDIINKNGVGTYIFGGIRAYNLFNSKISNLSIMYTWYGMSFSNGWNNTIDNLDLYNYYCAIYFGRYATTNLVSNVFALNCMSKLTDTAPTTNGTFIFDTNFPPYIKLESIAFIMEGDRTDNTMATFVQAIIQSYDACCIGTKNAAYFLFPYIEGKGNIYAYTYDGLIKMEIPQTSPLSTKTYEWGTSNGVIIANGFQTNRCYDNSEDSIYNNNRRPSYIIGEIDYKISMYYDNWETEIVEDEVIIKNLKRTKSKIQTINTGEFYLTTQKEYNENEVYYNATLTTGHYRTAASTFDELCKRTELNNIYVYPLFYDLYDTELKLENRNLTFKYAGGSFAGTVRINKPIKVKNSTLTFEDLSYYFSSTNLDSLFEVEGKCVFNVNKNSLYYENTSGAYKLSGTEPIELDIYLGVSSSYHNNVSKLLKNPEFEYPYTVRVHNVDGTVKVFTNTTRPTLGVPLGYQYFDTTLNKPIWKTSSGWVDATGAEV